MSSETNALEVKNKIKWKFSWFDLVKAVLYLVGDKKKSYVFWSVSLIFLFAYNIFPPLIVGKIVDFFMIYEEGNSLNFFYILIIIYGLSFSVVSFMRLSIKRVLGKMRSDIVKKIHVVGFEKLLSASMISHGDKSPGAQAQKINNGSKSFQDLFAMLDNRIFPTVISIIGILVVYLFLSAIYIVLILIYIGAFFLIIRYFSKKIQNLNYQKNIATEEASGSYIEGLNNILTIKSTGAEESFQDHIKGKEEIRNKFTHKIINVGINQWKTFQVYNGVFISIYMYLVGRDVALGNLTVGSIVIFSTYLRNITNGASEILGTYQHLIETKTGIGRMMPIFNGHKNKNNGLAKMPKWNSLKLKNISFEYKKEKDQQFYKGLKNVNLIIEKNTKIGLAGKTGSGKSTIAKLIVGLYEIDAGKYLIENTNFYDIKNEEVLKNISIVLQESEMFNMSLRDNITLMQKFDAELFEKAIKIAQLEEVINKLPKNIDTLIGEKGYHLSGGERQRVGIARAIYKNSPIIIFDEATSSLDNKTEQLVQQTLETELGDKTLIFIAHRITTLKKVDRIYVFKDGQIVEDGSYKELMNNKNSEFYRLNKKK